MHRLLGLGVRLAGITALIGLLIGLLGGQASAADETVSIGSATIVVGGSASVAVDASNFDAPGLGAWTIDVTYDPSVLSVSECEAAQVAANLCNGDFQSLGTTVRIVGASPGGLEGDTTLATITLRCESLGSSPLSVTVLVLADATPGAPALIEEPIIVNGSVACVALQPTSTPGGPEPTDEPGQVLTDEPEPTATATVVELTCDLFSFQEDAQAFYDENRAARSQLDADGDGLACELLPSRSDVAGTTQGPGLPGAGTGGGAPFGGMSLQGWFMAGLAGAGIAWLAAGLAGAGVSTLNAASPRRANAGSGRVEDATPPMVHETRIAKQPARARRERPAPAAAWVGRAREQMQDIDGTCRRLEDTIGQLGAEVQRVSAAGNGISILTRRPEAHDPRRSVASRPSAPAAEPRQIAAQEPAFQPNGRPVTIVVDGVPDFHALMEMQRALGALLEAKNATVTEYQYGQASFELELCRPATPAQVVQGLHQISGHSLLIEEAKPHESSMRLRFREASVTSAPES